MSEEKKPGQKPEGSPEGEASIEELKAQIATLTQERDNVVGELKEDREKRRELTEQKETLEKALEEATKSNTVEQPNDIKSAVEETVKTIFNERDASSAKENKAAALAKFVAENNEFAESNDPTGKKREALEEAVNRFNLEGLVSQDQFYSVIKDAARLLSANTTPQTPAKEEVNPYSSTPQSPGTPSVIHENNLSDRERKLVQSNGWTEERYKELKEKNPNYIDQLLSLIDKTL